MASPNDIPLSVTWMTTLESGDCCEIVEELKICCFFCLTCYLIARVLYAQLLLFLFKGGEEEEEAGNS